VRVATKPGGGNYNTIYQIFLNPTYSLLKSWLRTEEFAKLYNASLASIVPDINLTRAVTDYITKNASIIPINENGYGFAMAAYVKDGGWFERSSFLYWKPEQVWMNK
jgi:hypothetical protein